MEKNELSKNASGGTELMLARLHDRIDPDLLNKFQIIPTRVRLFEKGKLSILWIHDLPGDPELNNALHHEGWKRFTHIVCVSSWQREQIHNYYIIPYSAMTVINNAISIMPVRYRPEKRTIKKYIYTSTPHRGLDVLYHAFDRFSDNHENVHLDVFSSFALYGWPDRDKIYKDLFEAIKIHPKMTYHSSVSNEVIRDELMDSDVFVYPSTWEETSCLCLIEAMSADLLCIHSSLAALPETSGGLTEMYDFVGSNWAQVEKLADILKTTYENQTTPNKGMKDMADHRFGMNRFKHDWTKLLSDLLDKSNKRV